MKSEDTGTPGGGGGAPGGGTPGTPDGGGGAPAGGSNSSEQSKKDNLTEQPKKEPPEKVTFIIF